MELFLPSSLCQFRTIPSWSRCHMFQSRWFSFFEYLFSVLFLFLLGQPTASGCWSIYQCGVVFSGSITVSWALLFASLHICWAFFWIFFFFSGLKPHTFLNFLIVFFNFVSIHCTVRCQRSNSTALVGLLVGWWFSLLACPVGFGFSCSLLLFRIINRDMLLYVDDFSGSLVYRPLLSSK